MKLLLQGTKNEIEKWNNITEADNCNLPCPCRDCAFGDTYSDCCLTTEVFKFIKDHAEVVVKNTEGVVKDADERENQTELTETQKEIEGVVDGMKEVLFAKNARYGNAALAPLRIFSKKESTETDIPARLDDKLSRIKNSPELRVNDVADLIGYSVLLLVQMGVKKQDLLDLID